MDTIEQNLAKIMSAVYGKDVRAAIHDSIEQCYTDVTRSATAADAAASAANSAASAASNAATDAENAATAANVAAASAQAVDSVKYGSAQTLTDAQKGQARTNIGAANGELDKILEPVGLKEYVLTSANVPMNGLVGYLRLSNISNAGKISSNSQYIVYWFEAWSDMIITGIDTYANGAIGIRVSNEKPVVGVGSSASWTGVLYDTHADNMPTAESPAAVSKGQYVAIGHYVQGLTRSWALHVQISVAAIPTLAASLSASTFLNAYYDNTYLKRDIFYDIFGLIDYEQGFGDMSLEYDDTIPEGSTSGKILGIERKGMVVTLNSRVVGNIAFKVHLSGTIYRSSNATTYPKRLQFRTGHKYRMIVKYLSGNFIQKDDGDPVAPLTGSVYSTASPNTTTGVLVLNELMNGGVYIREVDGDDDMYNITLYCKTNLGTFHDYKVLVLLQDVTDGGVFKYLFGNDLLASAQALILENN